MWPNLKNTINQSLNQSNTLKVKCLLKSKEPLNRSFSIYNLNFKMQLYWLAKAAKISCSKDSNNQKINNLQTRRRQERRRSKVALQAGVTRCGGVLGRAAVTQSRSPQLTLRPSLGFPRGSRAHLRNVKGWAESGGSLGWPARGPASIGSLRSTSHVPSA